MKLLKAIFLLLFMLSAFVRREGQHMVAMKNLLWVLVALLIMSSAFATLNANNTRFYFSLDNSTSIGSTYVNIANNSLPNGTVVGTLTRNVTGIVAQAANFSNGRIELPNTIVQAQATNIRASWGGWVRVNSFAGRNWVMGTEVTGQTGGHGLAIETSGITRCYVAQGGSTSIADVALGTNPNIWRHIVCTYDGSNIRIYVNGTLQNTTASTKTLTVVANTWPIGQMVTSPSTYSNPFVGTLDEIFYANVTLNDSQVQALWNNGNGFNPFAPFISEATITVDGINEFTALMNAYNNNSNHIYSTTNGTIILPFNQFDTNVYNISIASNGYYLANYDQYNFSMSGNLIAALTPQQFGSLFARDVYSLANISTFTANLTGNYLCVQTEVMSSNNCSQVFPSYFDWSGDQDTDWIFPPSEMNDGTTPYTAASASGGVQYLYWNMSKPNAAASLIMETVVHTGLVHINVSIPQECFVQQPWIQIRMKSNNTGSPALDCWDGSWRSVITYSGNSAIGKPTFYWMAHADIPTTNGTIITPFFTNNPAATYNVSVNVSAVNFYPASYMWNFSLGNTTVDLAQAYAQFAAYTLFTNTNLTGGFVTINNVTLAQDVIRPLSAGTYTAIYQLPGYFNSTLNMTVDPVTNLTYNFTDVSTSRLTVLVGSANTGQAILSNITVTPLNYAVSPVTSNNTFNATFPLMNGTYTVDVDHPNYIFYTQNITLSLGEWRNLTIFITDENNFTFFFYDEETLLPIQNVSWYIADTSGPGEGFNGTTIGYNLTVANLSFAEYELRYNATGYRPRSYFFSVPATAEQHVNVTLYDVKINDSQPFFVRVTDNYNNFIPNLTISLLRRYIVDGQTRYYVVEQSRPMQVLGGQTLFSAVPNVVPYLFRVADSEGRILFQGAAKSQSNYEALYLVDQQMFIQLNTNQALFLMYLTSTKQSVLLQADNTSNTFWASFDDISPEFAQTCLTITQDTKQLSTQCSTARSGILSYQVNDTDINSYIASVSVVSTSGEEVTLQTSELGNDASPSLSNIFGVSLSAFFLIVIIIIASVAFASRPSILFIIIGCVMFAASPLLLGLTWLSAAGAGLLLIVTIILALIVRD